MPGASIPLQTGYSLVILSTLERNYYDLKKRQNNKHGSPTFFTAEAKSIAMKGKIIYRSDVALS